MDLPHNLLISRRALLSCALAASASAVPSVARAHNAAGVVEPPQIVPDLALTLDDGTKSTLQERLVGRVTALQLVFTGCSATCPIQGAIFGQGAKSLGDRVKDAQWLSVSLDPKNDDPKALRAWLGRFGAHARWHAGQPDPQKLDALVDFLKARNTGADRHTAQVYFFNRRAELVMRSVDFAPATEIGRVLKELGSRNS